MAASLGGGPLRPKVVSTELWKQNVRLMRTYGALKRRAPNERSRRLVESLSPEARAAAAANPDHSEAGRALAEQAVEVRRFDLSTPGWIGPRDLAAGEALFFGAERRLRRILIGLFAVSSALCAVTFLAVFRAPAFATPGVWGVTGCLVAISLIAATAAIALRRRPARVLLLRKFNDRRLSVMLQDLVFRELIVFGQVVTLSDRYIRRKGYGLLSAAVDLGGNLFSGVFILIVLRWIVVEPIRAALRLFNRARFGPAFVGSARDFRNLARRLSDRMGLNLEVTFTSKKAFMIRTTDRWWQRVVALLMSSADVVVVDISVVTSGTQWELDEVKARDLPGHTIFLVADGHEDAARLALERSGLSRDLPLLRYGRRGKIADRAALRAAVVAALEASVRRRQTSSGEIAQGEAAAADARLSAC